MVPPAVFEIFRTSQKAIHVLDTDVLPVVRCQKTDWNEFEWDIYGNRS